MSKSVRAVERAMGGNEEMILPVDYQPRTRIVFGADVIERVGTLAAELGARKALLVTDSGIVKAGHAERVRQFLREANISTVIYDYVRENPTTVDVESCLQVSRDAGVDTLIGLGGGSSMDTAKGCNFLLTNGGRMQDYWGVGKATKPMLPFIAIPTTAGTGSECQCAALIADEKTHQKMACLDPKAAARIAILDPKLTVSQPSRVAACTGIDAISHAVEAAVTTKRNPLSSLYATEAFKLLIRSFAKIFAAPDDLNARADMQLGAAYAGIAIENSMLGAAHAAANPLTAHFGTIHGHAVGLMLPHAVRFNAEDEHARAIYAELAFVAKICVASDPAVAVEKLIARLQSLLETGGLATRLKDAQVDQSKIPELAREAAEQWTARFNPRAISATDLEALYKAAF